MDSSAATGPHQPPADGTVHEAAAGHAVDAGIANHTAAIGRAKGHRKYPTTATKSNSNRASKCGLLNKPNLIKTEFAGPIDPSRYRLQIPVGTAAESGRNLGRLKRAATSQSPGQEAGAHSYAVDSWEPGHSWWAAGDPNIFGLGGRKQVPRFADEAAALRGAALVRWRNAQLNFIGPNLGWKADGWARITGQSSEWPGVQVQAGIRNSKSTHFQLGWKRQTKQRRIASHWGPKRRLSIGDASRHRG